MAVSRREVQNAIEQSEEYILKKGDSKKAIKVLEDILKDSEESSEEYYEILLKLSKVYRDNKSYNDALDLLKESIPKAKKHEMEIYLADIYRSISFIKLQQRKFAESRNYAKKALGIVKYMKGFKAEKTKANIYASLGNIYFTSKDYKDALKNYRKALKKAEDIGFVQRELTLKNDIANVYIEKEELDKAKDLLLRVKKKATKENPMVVPQVLLRLARVEYLQDNDDRSRAYIEQAIDYSKKMGWKRDIAEAREAMARIYKKEERKGNRKSELKKAQKIYKEIGLEKKADRVKKRIK
jgi:tetratricopeptide (TPR) repeat protein